MIAYGWLRALHLVCAVLWVGSMFFSYVILRPSLAALEPGPRMLLLTQTFRRLFLVIWHAMPLILISGLAMLFLSVNDIQHAPWQLHAMLGLGIVMSAIFVITVLAPYRQFRRTTDRNRMARSLDTIRKLIGVNLLLGLVTVIIGGLMRF